MTIHKTILMPDEGTLVRWLKKAGDQVNTGDVLAEIETGKATLEIESPYEGTLTKIEVAEGSTDIQADTVLAVIALLAE